MKLTFEQIKEITTGAVDFQQENGQVLLNRFTRAQQELYKAANDVFSDYISQ